MEREREERAYIALNVKAVYNNTTSADQWLG
jgi:hypothetical protein